MSALRPRDVKRVDWRTALGVVCLVALAINVPRDLFVAETRDVEVWLGFELTGSLARATAPLHWAIFVAGAWGCFRQRSWAVPAVIAYLGYVAVSHLVWSEVSPRGRGLAIGLVQAVAIALVAGVVWRMARREETRRAVESG